MLLGALEAGGTKMVCAVGNKYGEIIDQISIPTGTPKDTIPRLIEYFMENEIRALGIGAFGPINLDRGSSQYGYIKNTPKLHWVNYDLIGHFRKELNIPIGLDTDVNCSCLGEMTFGCAKGLDSVVYITIGTGIGIGAAVNGQLVHGMRHPEAGHILVRTHPDDPYEGICPYHKSCFEGMASGPAILERWGKKADELSNCSEVWELEAYYIAQAITTYILTYSPRKIILGGGVMHQLQLIPLIQNKVAELINGYIITEEMSDLNNYIVPSSLKDNQGILGCFELARRELVGFL